ncbi:MAG TPA: alanine--tRNA ligase [Fimbriimonadaceae bacterium]|nr:alanine--tRNA ligase [Fimbriimonadaceae bacterium]
MTARELRKKYLEFFESKGHTIHPSGSLVPYDVTGRLDESLLFNGAGMVQFKPYFRGVATPPNVRLTTAQKCVRTGDIDEVGNLTHLTFFEMLGNFSFGDYFKKEAIAFSWEFLTSPDWLALDKDRLSFTVFEEDDEAYGYWCDQLTASGVDPSIRVFRLGEETNYWPAGAFSKGPPGPCGPNSEMFYWTRKDVPPPTGPYTVDDWLRDDAAKNWLEIWNDVFIQFEWQGELRNPERPSDGFKKTGMPNLPFQSIDTGMGLERTAAVLGGYASVYETDLFQPILRKIESLCGTSVSDVVATDHATAMRIIADHIRTACFCIADGVLPSNNGRGYVLRRLIRRAVLKGLRVLGFDKPFSHLVYEGVVEAMGDHYTELVERRETIVETLKNEEDQFRRTIIAGSEMLQAELQSAQGTLSGEVAFRLYDTYGFPLEVTKELCAEAGITVDEEGYEAALKEAQARSRGASGMDTVYGGVGVEIHIGDQTGESTTPTVLVGYETTRCEATVVAVVPAMDGEIAVALNQTPFYAESGGQVSDTGVIRFKTEELGQFDVEVLDVVKQNGVYVHLCKPSSNVAAQLNQVSQEQLNQLLLTEVVLAEVNGSNRRRIIRNHTATHLLHAALRQVLGKHVTQAGSLVSEEHLRFDFTHGKAMTSEELAQVERIVNEQALAGSPVIIHNDLPIAQAKAMGAMALFGEKYGEFVRMVEIPGFSMELCGGIHVANTGEVGLFKILHEASAASGVRRIEAVSGEGAYEWANAQSALVHEAAGMLKSTPRDLVVSLQKNLDILREERKKREAAEFAMAKGGGPGASGEQAVETLGSIKLWRKTYSNLDQKIVASAVDDAVASDPALLAVAALISDGKVTFIAKAGAQAVSSGAHCGNLVKQLAQLTGGGGGGRPDFATAGGRDTSKVGSAMAGIPTMILA